jgi:hypothetical protein
MAGMTDNEIERLAEMLSAKLHGEGKCPSGWDLETVGLLRGALPELLDFACVWKNGKKTARYCIWGMVGLGAVTLFVIGLIENLKRIFQK